MCASPLHAAPAQCMPLQGPALTPTGSCGGSCASRCQAASDWLLPDDNIRVGGSTVCPAPATAPPPPPPCRSWRPSLSPSWTSRTSWPTSARPRPGWRGPLSTCGQPSVPARGTSTPQVGCQHVTTECCLGPRCAHAWVHAALMLLRVGCRHVTTECCLGPRCAHAV